MTSNIESSFTTKLHIDSANRNNGTSTNFIHICMPQIDNLKMYRFENVCLPHSWLNMWPDSATLVLSFTTAADGAVSVNIPNESYTMTDLLTTLQAAINAAITNPVALSSANQKVTFTPGDAWTVSGANLTETNSLWSFLGFTVAFGPTAAAFSGDRVANVSGPTRLYLHSERLSSQRDYSYNTITTQLAGSSMIKPITVTENSGELIWDDQPSEYTQTAIRSLGNVDFSLRYADGSLVDLRGENFQFTITLISNQIY